MISDRNIDGNEKLFPPFQVCGNDAVTGQSLPPNFGASSMLNETFFLLEEKKKCFVRDIFRFFMFLMSPQTWNSANSFIHYCTLKVTVSTISLESKEVSNWEIEMKLSQILVKLILLLRRLENNSRSFFMILI